MGCELLVVRLNNGGKFLYQHSTKQSWMIPDYPIRVLNAHSSSHAFCGGFLAGYLNSYDPVTAALHGNISECMAAEGLHPLSIFDALPGLAQSRLDVLKEKVKLL
jgi:sugar/nucleoside kinase (ribokinase family)